MRDTFIPRLHTEIWAEVRPMCEAALGAIGAEASGKVWTQTTPEKREIATPYVILNGDQDNATRFETLAKYGMGFDLEVRAVSDQLKQAHLLANEVKKRVTSLDSPPEPDGYSFRYSEPLSDVGPEALQSERSDLHEIIVRTRLYYRTAN